MPRASVGSDGTLMHFNAIRLRVNGSGNLKATFYSLDDVRSYPLVDIAMASAPGRLKDRICNVPYESRAFLELKTTEIDEVFKINTITIFTKPLATQIPG